MRAVIQRVSHASVVVDGAVSASIAGGLLVYLGVNRDDGDSDIAYMADKIRHLRIFSDGSDRMNLDVVQVGGAALVVSAFTLEGDGRRGRRPSFESAAEPDRAIVLYGMLCESLSKSGLNVQRGLFGSHMDVQSLNDGPVCVLLESRRLF